MNKIKKILGFSSIEIILATTIFAIFSAGIFYLSLNIMDRDSSVTLGNEALYYAQEGLEASRNLRNRNFLLLTNGDHGLSLVGNSWTFVPAPETIDDFYERTITISDVYRDEDGNLDPEGTVYDADTKKIDSQVSWSQNGIIPKSVVLTEYLSNWFGDDYIQTTCTDFVNGTFEDAETISLDSPPADNCGIRLLEIEEESEFFTPVNVGKHGNDVDVDGNYAYLATADNGKGLNIINVSNPSSPTIVGYENLGGKGNYVAKNDNYAYVGTTKWPDGITILDVSNPSNPSIKSTVLVGGSGNQPMIIDDYLFVAVENWLYSFQIWDVTFKFFPLPIDGFNYSTDTHVVSSHGDYAYIGVDDDHSSLKVFDISNIYEIEEIASLDVGEEINAIAISGSTAFIGIESSNSSLKVVDISNPHSPSLITSLNVNGEIQDLTISGDYLYAAVDSTQSGLAAVNISNPYNPSLSYNMDISGKGTGIDSDENYVYVSTNTSNKGLVIVGTTVTGSSTTGTYVSEVHDTGSNDTIYNFIEWVAENAPAGSVKFQLRTSSTEENITSATWVGPDSTDGTYYETSRTMIELDPGATGNRYLQIKLYLESDGVTTPIVESIRINYTP